MVEVPVVTRLELDDLGTGVELAFDRPPSTGTINELKAAGFRYRLASDRAMAWVAPIGEPARSLLQRMGLQWPTKPAASPPRPKDRPTGTHAEDVRVRAWAIERWSLTGMLAADDLRRELPLEVALTEADVEVRVAELEAAEAAKASEAARAEQAERARIEFNRRLQRERDEAERQAVNQMLATRRLSASGAQAEVR